MVNNKKPECFAVCRLLLAHWDLWMASSCKQGVDDSETGLDELFAQIPIGIGFATISSPIAALMEHCQPQCTERKHIQTGTCISSHTTLWLISLLSWKHSRIGLIHTVLMQMMERLNRSGFPEPWWRMDTQDEWHNNRWELQPEIRWYRRATPQQRSPSHMSGAHLKPSGESWPPLTSDPSFILPPPSGGF